MFQDFAKFIKRGNVLDLAVAVIVGGSFGKVVTSLVNDIIMPPIGLLLGKVDFSNLFIDLSRKGYANLANAKAAGVPTLNYGAFINTVIDFLIVSLVVFLMTKGITSIKSVESEEKPQPVSKTCPMCATEIPLAAKRCPHCTSILEESLDAAASRG